MRRRESPAVVDQRKVRAVAKQVLQAIAIIESLDLKDIRTQLGLSQESLARKLDMSLRNYQRHEKKHYRKPQWWKPVVTLLARISNGTL